MCSYDGDARIATVKARLLEFLSKHLDAIPVDVQDIQDEKSSQLEAMKTKVTELQKMIFEFEGRHYNPKYNHIMELCTIYQIELDRIHVKGRENLAIDKKKLIVTINNLIDQLNDKTHEDRLRCSECT